MEQIAPEQPEQPRWRRQWRPSYEWSEYSIGANEQAIITARTI
jgi:hypothetical protein